MIAAIHQPNFFPWLGYFNKIARADVFVFLDAVAFSKGSWTNRVQMLVAGKPRWVTCPILQEMGQSINQVQIDDRQPCRRKMVKTLEMNYGKAAHFQNIMTWVEPLVLFPSRSLAEYNMRSIREIASHLGLECRFVLQSQLSVLEADGATGSERLAEICKQLSADTYLAGDGADGYEDLSAYERAGVRMIKSGFRQQAYPQAGSRQFVPGLSILDALFNIGLHETRMLLAGREL
ncbi:MAG: WbqC family protein [Phycisphaerae bacterium]|nr:WbqC family protein [Phycisphaerae bacterium]